MRNILNMVAGPETIYTEHEFDPAKHEEIADTKAVEKRTDLICTIGPKSWDLEVRVNLMVAEPVVTTVGIT